MARLLINGDDLGMNESCSRAIAEAFKQNRITDTTAMANGEWIDEALALAREMHFENKIGVHLNLTEGKPLTREICGFPAFVTDGCFNKNAMTLNRELTAAEFEAVYAELTAQILRLKSAGIMLTHADSHHYIHNHPCFLPVVLRLCGEQGIDKLRLRRDLSETDEATTAEIGAYNRFLRTQGFITTDHFGRPEDVAGRDIPDLTELLVHPDFDRDGILIDRRGMSDGFPVGDELPAFDSMNGVELIDYTLL